MTKSTEEQYLADHNAALKEDLKQCRAENVLLQKQIADGVAEQEKLAWKQDFLLAETARLAASREQYERIAIRVSAILDGALTALMATVQQMHDEIRDAAFTKVPGTPKLPDPGTTVNVDVEKIAETFAAGFEGMENPALPPPPRFGSGAARAA
jgi:hypothetical protein